MPIFCGIITSDILTVGKFIHDAIVENYYFKLVRGFDIRITRGFGERQKNELIKTNNRIIGALYVQPYIYQQLWRATKIHRNTLKQRLDQLVKDDIVIKHHYTFPNYRGKYTSRDFYLLNWKKKQSKETMHSIFYKQFTRDSAYIMNPNVSRLCYEINSIRVEPTKREYTLITAHQVNIPYEPLYDHVFHQKIRELHYKEKEIFSQLRSYIAIAKPIEETNELVEKRDTVLESIILLCTRFCTRYLQKDSILSAYDMLIFFDTIGLFDYSLPYAKFWDIMKRFW